MIIPAFPLSIFPGEIPEKIWIAKAAVRFADHVYLSWRHSDALMYLIKNEPTYDDMDGKAQGFIDQLGYFWSREDAARIAYTAGQTEKPFDLLISEMMWTETGIPYRMPRPSTSIIATKLYPERLHVRSG